MRCQSFSLTLSISRARAIVSQPFCSLLVFVNDIDFCIMITIGRQIDWRSFAIRRQQSVSQSDRQTDNVAHKWFLLLPFFFNLSVTVRFIQIISRKLHIPLMYYNFHLLPHFYRYCGCNSAIHFFLFSIENNRAYFDSIFNGEDNGSTQQQSENEDKIKRNEKRTREIRRDRGGCEVCISHIWLRTLHGISGIPIKYHSTMAMACLCTMADTIILESREIGEKKRNSTHTHTHNIST